MNLLQLKMQVDRALEAGVPGDTVVCTYFDEHAPAELSGIEVHDGLYLDDPTPKMRARCERNGRFVLLGSVGETEWGVGVIAGKPWKFHVVDLDH